MQGLNKDIMRTARKNAKALIALRRDHYRISPTAKLVSYFRSQSDIPYASEVAKAIEAEKATLQLIGDKVSWFTPYSAPFLEARYKSMDFGVKAAGNDNLLELAMGLAPRGLAITNDSSKSYVGTDLPKMLAESYAVMRTIAGIETLKRPNLHFMPVNVTRYDQLKKAATYFEGKRFSVGFEGLFSYLAREEQEQLARTLSYLLRQEKGSLITPDIDDTESRERRANAYGAEYRKVSEAFSGILSSTTGRDVKKNRFLTINEAERFFVSFGFDITKYPMYDGSYALSTLSIVPDRLREQALDMLSSRKLWVLTPRV